MRVAPNSDVPRQPAVPATKTLAPRPLPADDVDVARAATLALSLKKTFTVRADKVALAKELLRDQAYPDDTKLDQIAGALANHLEPGNRGSSTS